MHGKIGRRESMLRVPYEFETMKRGTRASAVCILFSLAEEGCYAGSVSHVDAALL